MNSFLININGAFFNEHNALISVFDRGFLYGDSVYETTRTFSRIPFRFDKHLERLYLSAAKLDFYPVITPDKISSELHKTIQHSPHDNILIRLVLTRGTNHDLGLDPALAGPHENLIIFTKEIAPPPLHWYEKGVEIISYQKKSSVKGAYAKSASYQENVMAIKKANEHKAFEAIMINAEGLITECATSNIWLVKNQQVTTPPLEDGLLNGLTRQTILEILSREKIIHGERHLTLQDFLMADEVFLTSTNRELVPVVAIDGHQIGSGSPGAMTHHLLNLYRQFVISN